MPRPGLTSPRPYGRGLALTLLLGCGGASATGSFSATTTATTNATTSSTTATSASPRQGATAAPPPRSTAITFTIDARDRLPQPAIDERQGARAALVSQQPFSAAIVAIAVSGDGRFILAADERGAIALVDAASGDVRSARAVPRQANQRIHVELDARATRGLVALIPTNEGAQTEFYTWDLVTDALDRRLVDTTGAFAGLVALSPVGDAIVALELGQPLSPVGHLVRIDAATGERTVLPGEARGASRIGFTRGLGRPFVFEDDSGQRMHLVGDEDVRTEIAAPDMVSVGQRVALRPGGGQIAAIADDQSLAICSPIDGGCPSRVRWEGHRLVEVAYGAGGECIRVRDDGGSQAFVEASSGRFVATLANSEPNTVVIGACSEVVVPRAGGTFDRIDLRNRTPMTTTDRAAAAAVHLEPTEAPSVLATSENGQILAVAYEGVVMITTLPAFSSRAVDLVGVPGVVTDVLWTPTGDELFVRRHGEILRVSSERVVSSACSGESPGTMLHDGSVLFDADQCALRSQSIEFEIEGTVLATSEGANRSIIARDVSGNVERIDGAGHVTTIWPIELAGCRFGPDCMARAFLSRDGVLAVVRIGRAVRVFDIANGRTLVAFETDPADVVALTKDRRNLLVAHTGGHGLASYDMARGGSRVLLASGTIVFEADIEVDRYVVLDSASAPPRFMDALTNRPITIPTSGGLQVGRARAVHDDLFLVGTEPHQLVDAGRGRVVRTEGIVVDAVRTGDDVVAAICQSDMLQMLRIGAGDPQRVGTLGGCSRMGKVAIRPDGGAVAVAIADAVLVLRLGNNQPPIAIRTQLDANGYYMPIIASLAGPFDASDAAADILRMRRPGPLNSVQLDPARGNLQRQTGVQSTYFVRRPNR